MICPPKAKRISASKISRISLNSSALMLDTCFKDTMFKDTQHEIKNNSQEELLPQRDLGEDKK